MTIRTNTPNLLDNPPVPVQAKLAAAWTSLMFLSIYIDYFHLYRPGQIDVIRGGNIYKFHITPTLMTIFFVVIGIQALMVMLSMTLPARVNRATNLVVASLYIPVYVFNAAGASSDEAFYYGLTIGVEVLILAFILRSAWTWPRRVASPTATAASVYNEPLQTQHHA
jgi:Na+/H+ antiporter NhaA